MSVEKDPLVEAAERITGADLSTLAADLEEIPLPAGRKAKRLARDRDRGGSLVNENIQNVRT